MAATAPPAPTAVIKPVRGWMPLRLREFVDFRELLFFLVWRDVKVRYKQTALGVTWALLQPALTALIFALLFGRIVGVPSDGVPYPLFALSALVLWTVFAQSVIQGGDSLVLMSHVISKVYFPRLLVPVASIAALTLDFLIGLAVLVPVIVLYGYGFGVEALLAPLFILLVFVTAAGVSFWLSAMNVRYRDVKYAVPFLVQVWFFASPVTYPGSLLHGFDRMIYALNPMSSAIDGFRWALLGTPAPPAAAIVVSCTVALAALVSGLYYFRRLETTIADVI